MITCVACTIIYTHTVFLVQHNKIKSIYFYKKASLLNCMKVKREIILPDTSVQHDDRIDTYRLTSVSILYRYRLYHPSPSLNFVLNFYTILS